MGWLEDLGNGFASIAGAAGDAVEAVTETVAEAVERVVEGVGDLAQDAADGATAWVCDNTGDFLCGAMHVVVGGIGGFLGGIGTIVKDLAGILRGVGSAVGALLRLDIAGFVRGLADIILGVGGLAVDIGRLLTGGTIVGGVVRGFTRQELRSFVANLLEERFGDDEEQLQRIREHVGLEGGQPFGFPLPIQTAACMLDSANIDLAQLHQDGVIDLYALSGRTNLNFGASFGASRGDVFSVDERGNESFIPATRWQIEDFLNGGPTRLRAYPEREAITRRKLNALWKNFSEIGVRVTINGFQKRSSLWRWNRRPFEIFTSNQVNFDLGDREGAEQFLIDGGLFDNLPSRLCEFLLLTVFMIRWEKPDGIEQHFGNSYGRLIAHLPNLGQEPFEDVVRGFDEHERTKEYLQALPQDSIQIDRSDGCITMIDGRNPPADDVENNPFIGFVVYRDTWPDFVFRTVPTHEIGHLSGLCHPGHSLKDIMYTIAAGQDTQVMDWNLARYYYEREPSFTLQDGKNAWRFIVDQMTECLDPEAKPPA